MNQQEINALRQQYGLDKPITSTAQTGGSYDEEKNLSGQSLLDYINTTEQKYAVPTVQPTTAPQQTGNKLKDLGRFVGVDIVGGSAGIQQAEGETGGVAGQLIQGTVGSKGLLAAPTTLAKGITSAVGARYGQKISEDQNNLIANAGKFAQMAIKETDPTRKQHLLDLAKQSNELAGNLGTTAKGLQDQYETNKLTPKKALVSLGQTGLAALTLGHMTGVTGMGLNAAPGVTAADKALQSVSALSSSTAARRIATSTLRGGSLSGAQTFLNSLSEGKTAKDAFKDSVPAMAIGGAVGLGLSAGSELFKAITQKVPQKVYNNFIKESTDDAMKEINVDSMNALKTSDQTKYADYVKKGIIKELPSGAIKIDNEAARTALEDGIKGSPINQAIAAKTKLWDLENEVKGQIADKTTTLPNKQGYVNMLTDLKGSLAKDYGFGSGTQEIDDLLNGLGKTADNTVDGSTLLDLRRYLDSIRQTSSFRLNPSLSQSQETYKYAADGARKALNSIGTVGDTMHQYSTYIDILDSLGKQVQKTNNQAIINIWDEILTGGGMATGNIGAGLAASVLNKAVRAPAVQTYTAQGLYGLGKAVENIPAGARNIGAKVAGQEISTGLKKGLLRQ